MRIVKRSNILRYGISVVAAEATKHSDLVAKILTSDGGAKADEVLKNLKEARNSPKKVKEILLALRDEWVKTKWIVGFMGKLYDYQRVLEFDLEVAFGKPPTIASGEADKKNKGQKKEKNKAVSAEADGGRFWRGKLEAQFDTTKTGIKIQGKTAQVFRTDPEDLIKTLKRHFALTESGFANLIDSVDFSAVKELFLKAIVLKERGWNVHKFDVGTTQTPLQYLQAQFVDNPPVPSSAPLPRNLTSSAKNK